MTWLHLILILLGWLGLGAALAWVLFGLAAPRTHRLQADDALQPEHDAAHIEGTHGWALYLAVVLTSMAASAWGLA